MGKISNRKLHLNKGRWNHDLEEVETQAGSSTRSEVSQESSELESWSWDGDSGGSSRGFRHAEGRDMFHMMQGQRSPVETPTSTRSALRSSASLFVPGQCQPPPPPPAASGSGKTPVRCIIEGAFGSRLVSLNMSDAPSHTEVEVVLQPKQDEMFGPWSVDPQARPRALHMLLESFKILGPKIKSLQPSADESQISVGYSEVASDRLCWEHAQYGCCPRGPSCRWEHAVIEMYLITLVMQPLATDFSPVSMPPFAPPPLAAPQHRGDCQQVPVPPVSSFIIAAAPPPVQQVCSCGHPFVRTGLFCQFCGAKRPPEAQHQAAGIFYAVSAVPAGMAPPTLPAECVGCSDTAPCLPPACDASPDVLAKDVPPKDIKEDSKGADPTPSADRTPSQTPAAMRSTSTRWADIEDDDDA